MDQAGAGGFCSSGHGGGAIDLDGLEGLGAALGQDRDQIDDDVSVADRSCDRIRIAQIGLNRVNLPDFAERLQMPGEVGAAHGDTDAIIALGQGPDHMPSKETGSAEDRNEGIGRAGNGICGRGRFGHVIIFRAGRQLPRWWREL